MGLFKKKEPREIKEDDPTFIKLWYNPRSHAIIVLSAYFIFFLIIILFLNLSSKPQNRNNNVDASFLFDSLNNDNYKYNYLYKKDGEIYLFNLSIDENGDKKGLVSYDGLVKEVVIDQSGCKVTLTDEDDCPLNVNYNYFDENNLKNIIKNKKAVHYANDKSYKYTLDDGTIIYLYYISDKTLNKVVINEKDQGVYEINYLVDDTKEEELDEA